MWARIINAALGIWLMAAPAVFVLEGAAKNSSVICGALAVSFAIIAIWEVTRGLRWLNCLIGVWLMISPLLVDYGGGTAAAGSVAVGLVLTFLSLVRGRIKHQTGGGWAALFKTTEQR